MWSYLSPTDNIIDLFPLYSITQVIDLLEGIRSCELPLLCEKIMGVSITDWLVAPSLRKDGRVSERVDPQRNGSSEMQTQEQADDAGSQTEGKTIHLCKAGLTLEILES